MRTVTTNVYEYGELDSNAQARARDWFREGGLEYEWWDGVYEDAAQCAEALGIALAPDGIGFSGFSSQGDGAQWRGAWGYRADCVAAIQAHAPQDGELLAIAKELAGMDGMRAVVTTEGHYSHEMAMRVSVIDADGNEALDDLVVTEAMRDFARWIYRALESEYNYLNSDEQVAEVIAINAYEFDIEGNRA